MRHEAKRSNLLQNDWGYVFPTPWNQIEGALAYRTGTPVLVIAHPGVEGAYRLPTKKKERLASALCVGFDDV